MSSHDFLPPYGDTPKPYDFGRLKILPNPNLVPWICPVCGRGVAPQAVVCPCKPLAGWSQP